MLSYERNNGYDSKLVCQTASKPAQIGSEYMGGLGVTLIQDNVFTSSPAGASPSGNAVYSQLNDARFVTNQTTDVTVWLKGYILVSKTSKYDFSVSTNGLAVLYLSTDASSANKALVITGTQVASRNLDANT